MRIQIIGFSGSGKSTLAQKLGELYDIPVFHLDNAKFYGDFQERTVEDQTEIVKQFLENNENWVIDGNYNKICPERFEMADITIYLKLNRFVCYFSASKRAKKRKKERDDSFPCIDKFDLSFKFWVLFKGRTRKRKKMLLEILNKGNGKKLVFKNRKQVAKFLDETKNNLNKNNRKFS